MRRSRLILRSLAYYWRTNLAIIAGIAIAVAVLSGALLVGQSVKSSLKDLLYERIGATEYLISAEHFFEEELAASINSDVHSCPIILLKGVLTRERTGVRSHAVNVYGVDDRFWQFQGAAVPAFPDDRAAYVGDPLSRQLGIEQDDSILLRVEIPQAIPREWLYGRRDNDGRTLRLNCRRILSSEQLGEFALRPSQGSALSIFIPMKRLQKDLALPSKVNALLLARPAGKNGLEYLSKLLKQNCTLQDFGLRLQTTELRSAFSLESDRIVLDNETAQAAIQTTVLQGMEASPVYTYLANSIRAGDREIPYSVISAADIGSGALRAVKREGMQSAEPLSSDTNDLIWLTEWAQRDLRADIGQSVEVDYYLWQQEGKLETRTARFRVGGIISNSSEIDATMAPHIPGVTDARSITAWDPPFPLDIARIRPIDEEFWHRYKATPKAIISLATGQKLWESRFGKLTALRIALPNGGDLQSIESRFSQALLQQLNPLSAGFAIIPVRDNGLAASQGSTDFGEYFAYFSFFLIAAAILLAALFFRLMIEQRVHEIGILKACGFSTRSLQVNFLYEGIVLAVVGSILGILGSLAYGWLMLFGLRTWWIDAIGTRQIFLHISWPEMLLGCLSGVAFSLASLAWTLRTLRQDTIRMQLSGILESPSIRKYRTRMLALISFGAFIATALLLLASSWGKVSQLQGFFGSGFLLLIAILCATALYLRRSRPAPIEGHGMMAFMRMGLRNATQRPGRSLFCACLIAAATFIVVSMEAFRLDSQADLLDPKSGTGGFSLLAESTLPILYNLNSAGGQEALGLSSEQMEAFRRIRFIPFRKRPGDDVSCLNLYAPMEPEILGAPKGFCAAGRFSFQSSLASTSEQSGNPWLLLDAFRGEPFIPAIADANTLQYILRRSIGSEIVIRAGRTGPVRLRFVAALKDSIFQGKLIISESNFLRTFSAQEGYGFFLLETPPASAGTIKDELQQGLADYGFAVESTRQRLDAYHRVENTYISTFQALGTLGLFLGTFGMATILLRNVLERRQELALLFALGYRRPVVSAIILSENAFLIIWGLVSGIVCSIVAIMPAIHERGTDLPLNRIGIIVFLVFTAGLLSSLAAVIAAHRAPLLTALRSE